MESATHVPRSARLYVAVLLGVFLVTGAAGIEAWPFTGWKLFSGLRTQHDAAWSVAIVEGGAESPYPFARVPVADRSFVQILQRWDRTSPSDRLAICNTWITDARALGIDVDALHLYRIDRDLARRDGDRTAPGTRVLLERCDP